MDFGIVHPQHDNTYIFRTSGHIVVKQLSDLNVSRWQRWQENRIDYKFAGYFLVTVKPASALAAQSEVIQFKSKGRALLNATTGTCARLRIWKGACDWTGTFAVNRQWMTGKGMLNQFLRETFVHS